MSGDSTLTIWDNGIGMDAEKIKAWGRMGDSRSNDTSHSKLSPAARKIFLTSSISLYGVGSKKAIFNLGSAVTVTSKSQNSEMVHEVTLDKEQLKKSNDWRVEVRHRV